MNGLQRWLKPWQQPAPWLALLLLVIANSSTAPRLWFWRALLLVNGSALFIRLFMLWALRGCYAERGLSFWFSWLADLAASWRLTLSTARRPKAWRGRSFESLAAS